MEYCSNCRKYILETRDTTNYPEFFLVTIFCPVCGMQLYQTYVYKQIVTKEVVSIK